MTWRQESDCVDTGGIRCALCVHSRIDVIRQHSRAGDNGSAWISHLSGNGAGHGLAMDDWHARKQGKRASHDNPEKSIPH
jgi:hypothetical protein